MSPIDGMLYGFGVAFTPINVLAAFIGVILGTAVGVLPGLGPMATMAIVLPLTFGLPTVTSLIAMASIYYGAMYGGSTTAILVNIPGEVASIVTCLEGYQMTKKGRAGAALSVVAMGSFIAGTVAVFGVMFFSPVLATLALSFGPGEFFALTTVALLSLAGISSRSFARSIFGTGFGLMMATVGVEAVTGSARFTYGSLQLAAGFDVVPVAVGLFGVSEMFFVVENLVAAPKAQSVKLRELFPTREELGRSVGPWVRGSVVGFFIGLLPGPVSPLSTFISYRVEKGLSRRKEEFGHGAIEGVAGPEAANNAASEASFVPLLSLGIPFNPTVSLLLAAMMIQGIAPGPLLVAQHPEIFWGVIASMFLGNMMCLILNLPLVGMWVSLLRVPTPILSTGIILGCIIGGYSVNNSMFDLWVLFAFGVIGYFFRKMDFDLAGLILAIVLGPRIEKHFREALFVNLGDPSIFYRSPISIGLWLLGAVILFGPPLLKRVRPRARALIEEAEKEVAGEADA